MADRFFWQHSFPAASILKCPICVESTKAAKFVLYKAQLVAKKLAHKKKKQTLWSTKTLTSG